jgi:hypothetical protein
MKYLQKKGYNITFNSLIKCKSVYYKNWSQILHKNTPPKKKPQKKNLNCAHKGHHVCLGPHNKTALHMKFQEAKPYLRNCHLAILGIIWLSGNPKVHYRFHIRLHLVQTVYRVHCHTPCL